MSIEDAVRSARNRTSWSSPRRFPRTRASCGAMDLGINVICEKNMASDCRKPSRWCRREGPPRAVHRGRHAIQVRPPELAAKKFFELDPHPLGKCG